MGLLFDINVPTQVSTSKQVSNVKHYFFESNYQKSIAVNYSPTISVFGQSTGAGQDLSTISGQTQTAATTTSQSAEQKQTATMGSEWWQWLIIGGVVIAAAYFLTRNKGNSNTARRAAKYV